MATGLLGFNPYGGASVLDISSKPVNLAIQLEQKEAAKRDALQKYLMDYEKSLNPAGMRAVDQDAFLSKLSEAKQHYLKNTQQILNPAKYGSEAQSTYTGLLKDAQNIIEQSKVQGADDKVVNEHIYQATQQGKAIHDGLLPSIEASRLSIVDPRFRKVNPWELKFDDKYDDSDLVKNVWGGITLPTREVIAETRPNGEVVYRKESFLTPQITRTAISNSLNDYTTKPGAARHFNELMKQPQIYGFANNAFGEAFKYIDPATQKEVKPNIGDRIPGLNLDPTQQFVAGYALAKKPSGEVSESKPEFPWLTKFNLEQNAINRRHRDSEANANARAAKYGAAASENQGNELDNIEDIPFKGGGGIKNGVALDANGNMFSGDVAVPKSKIPGLLFNLLNIKRPRDLIVTYKDGVAVKMVHPSAGAFSRDAINNYQLKWNTEPGKGRQPQFGKPKSDFVGVPEKGF